ncbi:MAG: hypothetical protein IPL71_00985 [Anaerolineales bacterium]|uniref:hypothetical protein n=1 Tax=Candidatus Villigracilis proximus TaxID=3140683 RepID=UPI0031362A8D|nr:hypothetical protein [Anaerolineales bacterium]
MGITLWRSKWIILLGIFALNIIAGAFALVYLSRESGARRVEKLEFASGNKLLGFLIILLGFFFVWAARLIFLGNILPQVTPIFWVFLWASLFQALGLKLITGHKWYVLFALTILVQGIIYQVYGHLTIVTDYPFSIGYSEAGRHYYASMYHAKSLYDMQLPLPFLHPSRYFLLSLPFLVEGLPLWAHRFWQSLLWIGLTATSSVLLARRLSLKGWIQFFVAAWAFLYFFQGAVYYHLHICVILILAGVSVKHPLCSLVFVILSSVWAGVSRVNWFPVPAMFAIAIYLLETPVGNKGWRYWLTPFVWGASGLISAVISQFIYIRLSGNADVSSFGSSFTSDLLWNRLLPNETFPLGIILGITLVAAPLIVAIIQIARGQFSRVHPLRWAALFAMLSVLLLGGLIVSVKIGGGADLHNMDAFLVLLAIIATSFFAGHVAGEDDLNPIWGQIHWSVTVAALLVPLGFALPQIGFLPGYDHVKVEKDIQTLQSVITQNEGEILFVTERQLLTFGELNNVRLVPEYEQSELMEMAMSGNREYLETFIQTSSIIVLHSSSLKIKNSHCRKKVLSSKKIMPGCVMWVRRCYAPINRLRLSLQQIFKFSCRVPASLIAKTHLQNKKCSIRLSALRSNPFPDPI